MTNQNPTGAPRPLTTTEIERILAGIRDAVDTAQLLRNVLYGVFDALLADTGQSLDTLPEGTRLDTKQFAIPSSQWQAIVTAAGNRAAAWGTSAELFLHVLDLMPASYPDPSVPAPRLELPDYRAPVHELHVSREAADTIAACGAHVAALSAFFGAGSPVLRRAAVSWQRQITGLFLMSFGADTRVESAGGLSLTVHTGSGFVYGIVFHGDRRRCLTCDADIADDDTAQPPGGPAPTTAHEHIPSYPLNAPQPGQWITHS